MKIFLIVICILFTKSGLAQQNILGKYLFKHQYGYQTLELLPNKTFNFYSITTCRPVPRNEYSGTYHIDGDTLKLNSNDSIQKKYLIEYINIGLNDHEKHFKYYYLTQITNKNNILSKENTFKLIESYWENGRLLLSIQELQDNVVYTFYYDSGQIEKIERYKNGKNYGDWYSFHEDGRIKLIEKHKGNRIKKTVGNTRL